MAHTLKKEQKADGGHAKAEARKSILRSTSDTVTINIEFENFIVK